MSSFRGGVPESVSKIIQPTGVTDWKRSPEVVNAQIHINVRPIKAQLFCILSHWDLPDVYNT